MRRLLLIALLVPTVTLIASSPARAKGLDSAHAKVTITGPGLPGGIVTLGDDGAAFVFGSGVWEDKWDAPNIAGSLRPDIDLGPAYDVHVVLDCRPDGRSRYHQTLYPNAPEGPQLYTPDGVEACGTPGQEGFDPVGQSIEVLLRAHGVAFHPGQLETEVSPTAARTETSTSASAGPLVAGAVVLVLGAAAWVVGARRRRAPARPA
jgi:hypothetical protein